MNVLMINGTHPATPHISGVRAARFARELARLGHRCVLICPPPRGQRVRPAPPLARHDWSTPYVLEVDDPEPKERGAIATLASLVRSGGRRTAFQRNVVTHGRALTSEFRPDIGWATFGSLEAVTALRDLARDEHFPWILDDKDNPDIYLPRVARRPLARRVRGYAAVHSNAVLHADAAERWLGDAATVIYSGIDPCFFDPQPAPEPVRRYVTLVGSLYRRDVVETVVGAVADYNAASGKPPLGIVHLGTQGDWLANDRGVAIEAPGYIAPAAMAALCQHAVANLYVFLGRTFHHKLFELLACRRPVISYGGELPESLAIARDLHAPLSVPTSPAALAATLAQIDGGAPAVDPRMPARFFTWPQQAAILDAEMRRIAG